MNFIGSGPTLCILQGFNIHDLTFQIDFSEYYELLISLN